MEVSLTTQSLMTLPENVYPKNFEFKLSDRSYMCSSVVADFLSPRIARIHSRDPTVDSFELTTRDDSNQFQDFLSLANGGSVSIHGNLFFASIADELENLELISLIQRHTFAPLDASNVLVHFSMKEALRMTCDEEIAFLASHFEACYEHHFRDLAYDLLYQIFSHPSFKISNEDWLYAQISKLFKADPYYLPLLEFINFEFLTQTGIASFIADSCEFLSSINITMWRRICCRLYSENRSKLQVPDRTLIRVFIHSASFPEMSIDIHPLKRLSALKFEIRKRTEIPTICQKLEFSRKILADDDTTLSDYGIQSGSSLNLLISPPLTLPTVPRTALVTKASDGEFPIMVRGACNRIVLVSVNGDTTIEELQSLIDKKCHLPVASQFLMYGGKPLHDGVVSDYGINRNSILDCRIHHGSAPNSSETENPR
jgi:hypothetical protein